MSLDQIPVRLCCGERHLGAVCPDGQVMCCMCFERFPIEELAFEGGAPVDVCVPCMEHENEGRRRRSMPTYCPRCGHREGRGPGHFMSCPTIVEVQTDLV